MLRKFKQKKAMKILIKARMMFLIIMGVLGVHKINAQSVLGELKSSKINYNGKNDANTHLINLGADVVALSGIHGITFKFKFDPGEVYADSILITANSHELGLKKSEYLEMQRIDSTYVLYSLTIKGRDKVLKLDSLPVNLHFVIKPETYYQLVRNNCEHAIEFEVESLLAYDGEKNPVNLKPFVLPVDLECESEGELQYLLAAPNPTDGKCWVYIPQEKMEKIRVIHLFDVKGERKTIAVDKSHDQLELNFGNLRPGHYYLNIIYTDNKKDVVKVVKI
jgi:hypothetical protein